MGNVISMAAFRDQKPSTRNVFDELTAIKKLRDQIDALYKSIPTYDHYRKRESVVVRIGELGEQLYTLQQKLKN